MAAACEFTKQSALRVHLAHPRLTLIPRLCQQVLVLFDLQAQKLHCLLDLWPSSLSAEELHEGLLLDLCQLIFLLVESPL